LFASSKKVRKNPYASIVAFFDEKKKGGKQKTGSI